MNLAMIDDINKELALIPHSALFGLYGGQGVRLIAQSEYASLFVFNSRTDKPFLLDCNDFATYMRHSGFEETELILQKINNDLSNGE